MIYDTDIDHSEPHLWQIHYKRGCQGMETGNSVQLLGKRRATNQLYKPMPYNPTGLHPGLTIIEFGNKKDNSISMVKRLATVKHDNVSS